MIKLNKVITEDFSGTLVEVSYNPQTKLFKVASKEDKKTLIEDKEGAVNLFLEVNGAYIYAPRYMSNYPNTLVNDNTANKMSHLSPFGLLEFLRVRNGDTTVEMTIYPREKQAGNRFIPGIKIPLGECLVDSLDKTSMINLMINHKDVLQELKKIAVRTYKESDDREIAFVSGNKYYPMTISAKDVDAFVNSVSCIGQTNNIDVDTKLLSEALKKEYTMSVISQDVYKTNNIDTLTESMNTEELINSHVVVFESSNLNALSKTMFCVHPEANYRKWKVSEIKESINKHNFFFEVQGENTDALLNDDLILGRMLCEDVYITHRTPLHESSPTDKAVFALKNGLDMDSVLKSLISEQLEANKKEKQLKECDFGNIGGVCDISSADIASPAVVQPVSTDSLGAVTSKDIMGAMYAQNGMPMCPAPKKKEKQSKISSNKKDIKTVSTAPLKKISSTGKTVLYNSKESEKKVTRESVLEEMGILDKYNKIMGYLKEDGEENLTSTSILDTPPSTEPSMDTPSTDNLSSSDFDLGSSSTETSSPSMSDFDFGNHNDSNLGDNSSSTENNEEQEEQDDTNVVGEVSSVSNDGNLYKLLWGDGTTSTEVPTNLEVASSVATNEPQENM